MQLSVITDEISQDFEHALDVMLEYDVRAAELRGLWNVNIGELSEPLAVRAKEALKARDMKVSCLSTPIFKCDLFTDSSEAKGPMHLATSRGMEEQQDLLMRCIHWAHWFDTPLLRIFTFWRQGAVTSEIEKRIAEALNGITRIAEKEGVILALENEHACFIGTGAETRHLVSQLQSPAIQVCWDAGNAFFAGERPYPDGFQAVKPWLKHIHIKDAYRNANGKPVWCVVGEGEIDYVGQFAELKEMNYTGYLSLETHYIPDGGTSEAGSRACLAAMKRMIKD